jgi:UDP-2,3-diacylglucosamine pyrophosphatase LpxH
MKYKYVFISDTHLGSKFAKAKELCQFLNSIEVETLCIVGDFIDFWALKKHNFTHWGKAHNEVLRALLNKLNSGTRIIWIRGNHDLIPNGLLGEFKNVEIVDKINIDISFVENDQRLTRTYLVLHGHQFDTWLKHVTFLYGLGSFFYEKSLTLSKWLSSVRQTLGYKPWSLAQYLKSNTKHAVSYLSNFSKACVIECSSHGADGVICGHIHHPQITSLEHDGKVIQYINCGDWVESLSYIVVTDKGIELKFYENQV